MRAWSPNRTNRTRSKNWARSSVPFILFKPFYDFADAPGRDHADISAARQAFRHDQIAPRPYGGDELLWAP